MSRLFAAMRCTATIVLCLALTGCRVLTFVGDVWDDHEFDIPSEDDVCESNCRPTPYVGLGRYWTPRDNFTVERLAHKCFDKAWDEYLSHCSHPPSRHFRNGFEDAFDEIADGGNGVIPPIPPKKYWNTYYRSPEGKVFARQWFNGYRIGVEMARVAGLDKMNQIATSVPDPCGCGGRGCQQCAGGAIHTPGFGPTREDSFWNMPSGSFASPTHDSANPYTGPNNAMPSNGLPHSGNSGGQPADSPLTPIPEPFPSGVLTNPAAPRPAVPALPQPGSSQPLVPNPGSGNSSPANNGGTRFLRQPSTTPATVPFPLPQNPSAIPNSNTPVGPNSTPSEAIPGDGGHSIPPASQITPAGQFPTQQFRSPLHDGYDNRSRQFHPTYGPNGAHGSHSAPMASPQPNHPMAFPNTWPQAQPQFANQAQPRFAPQAQPQFGHSNGGFAAPYYAAPPGIYSR